MIIMIIIAFINESLVSDTLTVLCVGKTMYDLRNVTSSKLLNPSEPRFSLFCENMDSIRDLVGIQRLEEVDAKSVFALSQKRAGKFEQLF